MDLPQGANPLPDLSQQPRDKLKQVRDTVLALHKALLDSERTLYEINHGPVGSPAAFLQLLINDAGFAWLQPMTNLIVLIDETLAAKRPPAEPVEFVRLLADTRALLSPSTDEQNAFWKRYWGTLQRDPAVRLLHQELENRWAEV